MRHPHDLVQRIGDRDREIAGAGAGTVAHGGDPGLGHPAAGGHRLSCRIAEGVVSHRHLGPGARGGEGAALDTAVPGDIARRGVNTGRLAVRRVPAEQLGDLFSTGDIADCIAEFS